MQALLLKSYLSGRMVGWLFGGTYSKGTCGGNKNFIERLIYLHAMELKCTFHVLGNPTQTLPFNIFRIEYTKFFYNLTFTKLFHTENV